MLWKMPPVDQDLCEELDSHLGAKIAKEKIYIFIMGPDLKSDKPSGKLRRELVDRCNKIGHTALAEHKHLINIGKKRLGAGFDLTTYEKAVAEISHVIVLIPDSAGSYAELGFFGPIKELSHKMIIFLDKNHEPLKEDSYIWEGPAKAAKNNRVEVPFVDYDNVEEIWQMVLEQIEIGKANKIREQFGDSE